MLSSKPWVEQGLHCLQETASSTTSTFYVNLFKKQITCYTVSDSAWSYSLAHVKTRVGLTTNTAVAISFYTSTGNAGADVRIACQSYTPY